MLASYPARVGFLRSRECACTVRVRVNVDTCMKSSFVHPKDFSTGFSTKAVELMMARLGRSKRANVSELMA